MNQIQAQLQRIHRQHWFPTLKLLIDNFDGALIDPRDSIIDGILEVLKSIKTNDKHTDLYGIRRFQKMFCFTYRIYKGIPAIYWDPTQESFADFSHTQEKISIYEVDDSHPAPDILIRWFTERFNQAKRLN